MTRQEGTGYPGNTGSGGLRDTAPASGMEPGQSTKLVFRLGSRSCCRCLECTRRQRRCCRCPESHDHRVRVRRKIRFSMDATAVSRGNSSRTWRTNSLLGGFVHYVRSQQKVRGPVLRRTGRGLRLRQSHLESLIAGHGHTVFAYRLTKTPRLLLCPEPCVVAAAAQRRKWARRILPDTQRSRQAGSAPSVSAIPA